MADIDFDTRNAYMNRVLRTVIPLLKGSEFKVLMFVLDRTIRYNKTTERISAGEISKGIELRNGMESYGTGVSRQKALGHLKELEGFGLIKITSSDRKGTWVEVNLGWRAPDKPLRPELEVELGCVREGDTCSHGGNRGVASLEGGLKRNKENKEKEYYDASGIEKVPEALQQAVDESNRRIKKDDARRARKSANRAGFVCVKECESIWRSAIIQRYGADHVIVKWTGKERGQIKHLQNKLGMETQATRFTQFLEFVGKYWDTILENNARWATETAMNSEPSIGFVLKFADVFARAFNDKAAYLSTSTFAERVAIKEKRRDRVVREPAPEKVAVRAPTELEQRKAVRNKRLKEQSSMPVPAVAPPKPLKPVKETTTEEYCEWADKQEDLKPWH